MSFSNIVKKELTAIAVKNTCCRRAFALGLIAGGFDPKLNKIVVKVPSEDCSQFCLKLLKERFNKISIFEQSVIKRGEKIDILEIDSDAVISSIGTIENIKQSFKGDCCISVFLRAVFISIGTVSDPHSTSYHAEFSFQNSVCAKIVYDFLCDLELSPGITNRKNGTVGLYYKSSSKIEELLINLGANSSAFEFINCKIERTIRNDENRATNCVAKNISKSVEASRRQIEEIELLISSGRIDVLPYDLRVTANLRVNNPEASLTELAALHVPPISKSGLNHRLKKLSEESKKINTL